MTTRKRYQIALVHALAGYLELRQALAAHGIDRLSALTDDALHFLVGRVQAEERRRLRSWRADMRATRVRQRPEEGPPV